MSFAGSSLNEALQRLSAAMKINNLIGQKEQAAWTSETRVVWSPIRMQYDAPHEQPSDGKACAEVWITCDVEVRGTDWSAFENISNKLQVALYEEFSENTFERVGEMSIGGGDVDSQSFGGIAQVALLFPVYVHRYGKANVTSIDQSGSISGPLGDQESAP